MSRVRSMQYDDQDQIYWDGGQEVRKTQSARDRCKKRKSKSIRRGIDEYWEKHQLHQDTADGYESFDEFDDSDRFNDSTLH
ncbi:hypothetical protein NX722_16405 [Endozoicomonas gorgoniicola]|uniref:Uncharacterized protein n=1 Tax=Endozoicomonas gorgoniicola TaxID=1234144 RepID=A0ABT3MYK4_9GAMM|nr:hypothetical protein [Endozoicomonas gorgoniicola]MCW7554173.1 hypothetical protein [Endozoicomonas gorgoniicola]